MTPQERDLVTELFDRLATLENSPRDPEAERVIIDGLRRAPNAVYALVQTVLVQDEALKRADARIRELESDLGIASVQPRDTGFLGSMREALFGRQESPRATSVPSVRPGATAPSAGGLAAAPGYGGWQQPAPGGSFLGTAAAAAAGVIGGSLMLDAIRSMMGHHAAGFGNFDRAYAGPQESGAPWRDSSNSDLARDAGLDDIGRGGGRDASDSAGGGFFGLFGGGQDDADADDINDADYEDDGGFDGGDAGGSDC